MNEEITKLTELGKKEAISSFLDMRLEEISPGYARVSMPMKSQYLNFNGMIFGGIICSVADQAFAYATNSVITPNVATQFNIHFINAVSADDTLTAECHVLKTGKRVCISEIKVYNKDRKIIAMGSGTTIPLISKT